MDAYAKISSWKFPGNGSAYFSTKMVYSDSYKQSLRTNDIAPYLLGAPTNPPFSLMEMAEAMKNGMDNMNVNVLNYGKPGTKDDFVVVSDIWKGYMIDPDHLSTKGPLDPPIPGSSPFDAPMPLSSGHPLPEPGTGNHLTFVSATSMLPGRKSELRLIRILSGKERELVATIQVDKVSYMHSFAVSGNYAILIAQPMYIDVTKMKNMSPLEAFSWNPQDKVKYYVVNLKTGFITTVEGDNLFYLHTINAYEPSPSEIAIDLAVYKDNSALLILNMTKLENLDLRSQAATSTVKRVILNLENKSAKVNTLPSKSNATFIEQLEYPTINENYRFKKHCYIFGISFNVDHKDFLHMAVVKKDVCSGNDKYWFSPNKYYNEAWFEPRPGAVEEDDGVLILPIFDKITQKTNFTIFDAKDLTVINNAPLPTSNPFGTHGRFFSGLL